ncbi:MAG: hypothetical protein LH606_05855 [Cytophagaceae bacterium]|nr:hypothetical protein [Cytophagaceae bacterium]
MSTSDRRIHFLGKTVFGGKIHDYTLLKNEFPTDGDFFINKHLNIDLGYQGIAKDYKLKSWSIPIKKPRKSKKNPEGKFTQEQKEYNWSVSRRRVCVENSIAGMKRDHILCIKYRGKSLNRFDESLEVCAGLWNYRLSNRGQKKTNN